jgi:dienelactone hydrolase
MVRPAAVQIKAGRVLIEGDLMIPITAAGLVVFAHGSGSSRFSRRNQSVAQVLHRGGYATLLLDLLTREEDKIDEHTRQYRFDVDRLGHRIVAAIDWAAGHPETVRLPIACFGATTGAAAALIAAAEQPEKVGAVISRGDRPDLAGYALPKVQAPTSRSSSSIERPCAGCVRPSSSKSCLARLTRSRSPVHLNGSRSSLSSGARST